jgi:hypothetical protein
MHVWRFSGLMNHSVCLELWSYSVFHKMSVKFSGVLLSENCWKTWVQALWIYCCKTGESKVADPVKQLYFVISLLKCLFYFIIFYSLGLSILLAVRNYLLHFLCIFSLILQHKLFPFVCPTNCSVYEQQHPHRSPSLIYCISRWSNLFIYFQKKSQRERCL